MSPVPLIGLAHGSRHPLVGQALDELMAEVGGRDGRPGFESLTAYLDLTDPDLTTVVADLGAAGHKAAVIVPLLFTQAFHATVDVPDSVRESAAATGVDLVIAEVLGTGDDVADVLELAIAAAEIPADAQLILFAVGSSDAAANDAVRDLGDRLHRRRSQPVHAAFATCEPRGSKVLEELSGPVAVVPLFVSAGLLLDRIVEQAGEQGAPVSAPLGKLLAPLVADRYRAALTEH